MNVSTLDCEHVESRAHTSPASQLPCVWKCIITSAKELLPQPHVVHPTLVTLAPASGTPGPPQFQHPKANVWLSGVPVTPASAASWCPRPTELFDVSRIVLLTLPARVTELQWDPEHGRWSDAVGNYPPGLCGSWEAGEHTPGWGLGLIPSSQIH